MRVRVLAALALLLASLPVRPAAAELAFPALELRAGLDRVRVERVHGEPVYLGDLGIYVSAVGAPFEIWLTRNPYASPVEVNQVVYDDGVKTLQALPFNVANGWTGFDDFFQLELKRDGRLLRSKALDFCPNTPDRQRVNDAGPVSVSYMDGCFGNPFTKGMVWGLDEGWAANATSTTEPKLNVPSALYDLRVSISPRYVDLFNIDAEAASVDLQLKVVTATSEPGCKNCWSEASRYSSRSGSSPSSSASGEVPTELNPDPAVLPDLVALPAWGISLSKGARRERLTFGATLWTSGAQSLVVEGFREQGEPYMDAFQYFYEGGEPVGRAPVGEMDYDPRKGHDHWHFLQFARYSLLDASKTEVLVSKKEAFCLLPTDAIDLTLPGAEMRPNLTGLSTACGAPSALWVREVLPLGWGDTYFQGLPGQSFNISNLPNGTYFIEVEANPSGNLYEQTSDNNVILRKIFIKGRPGARFVKVPDWNGIDTESGDGRV